MFSVYSFKSFTKLITFVIISFLVKSYCKLHFDITLYEVFIITEKQSLKKKNAKPKLNQSYVVV